MISIEIKIKEIPKTCSECKFYRNDDYRCHNEMGTEAYCLLGYMDGKDMRDINFKTEKRKTERYSGCLIEKSILP